MDDENGVDFVVVVDGVLIVVRQDQVRLVRLVLPAKWGERRVPWMEWYCICWDCCCCYLVVVVVVAAVVVAKDLRPCLQC